MSKLFSKDYINLGRQQELDIFKGAAVLIMVWSHVLDWFATYDQLESGLPYFIYVILSGPPGATTFMFCMGIGIWYSAYKKGQKATLDAGYLPEGLLKRGVMILIVGLVLNFIRGIIFPLIGYALFQEAEYIEDLKYFFCADIYQFAGLTFIVMWLLQKLKIKAKWMIPIALVFSAIGWLTRTVGSGESIFALIFSAVLPLSPYSCFPLVNWFIFPVAGYFFAPLLARCKNKGLMYGILGGVGTVIFVIYSYICATNNIGFCGWTDRYDGFFCCTTIDAFLFFSAIFSALLVAYLVSVIFKKCKFVTLNRWSKNIMGMYAVSWILILLFSSIPDLLEIYELSLFVMFLISVAITVLSDLICIWYYKKKEQKKQKKLAEQGAAN